MMKYYLQYYFVLKNKLMQSQEINEIDTTLPYFKTTCNKHLAHRQWRKTYIWKLITTGIA